MSKVAQAIVNRINALVTMSTIIKIFEHPMERIREIEQIVNYLVAEDAISQKEFNELRKLIDSACSVISKI